MLNAPVMEANDAVSGSMAECYVTIDGNRYNMMQLYSFEVVREGQLAGRENPRRYRHRQEANRLVRLVGRARRTLTRACSAAWS